MARAVGARSASMRRIVQRFRGSADLSQCVSSRLSIFAGARAFRARGELLSAASFQGDRFGRMRKQRGYRGAARICTDVPKDGVGGRATRIDRSGGREDGPRSLQARELDHIPQKANFLFKGKYS